MIVDNRENIDDRYTYDQPLSTYFRTKYSYIGNILIDLGSATTLYMDLPYISKDAGILFKLWFFDRLCEMLKDVSTQKFFIVDDTIKQKILVKQQPDSLIVENVTKKVCTYSRGKYVDRNNGTYIFHIVFPDEVLPNEMCQMIESEFHNTVNLFRLKNNENTL